jgi:hypothetical protein
MTRVGAQRHGKKKKYIQVNRCRKMGTANFQNELPTSINVSNPFYSVHFSLYD